MHDQITKCMPNLSIKYQFIKHTSDNAATMQASDLKSELDIITALLVQIQYKVFYCCLILISHLLQTTFNPTILHVRFIISNDCLTVQYIFRGKQSAFCIKIQDVFLNRFRKFRNSRNSLYICMHAHAHTHSDFKPRGQTLTRKGPHDHQKQLPDQERDKCPFFCSGLHERGQYILTGAPTLISTLRPDSELIIAKRGETSDNRHAGDAADLTDASDNTWQP